MAGSFYSSAGGLALEKLVMGHDSIDQPVQPGAGQEWPITDRCNVLLDFDTLGPILDRPDSNNSRVTFK